jgi:hypothetical protein
MTMDGGYRKEHPSGRLSLAFKSIFGIASTFGGTHRAAMVRRAIDPKISGRS